MVKTVVILPSLEILDVNIFKVAIDALLEKYPNIGPRYSLNENKFVMK